MICAKVNGNSASVNKQTQDNSLPDALIAAICLCVLFACSIVLYVFHCLRRLVKQLSEDNISSETDVEDDTIWECDIDSSEIDTLPVYYPETTLGMSVVVPNGSPPLYIGDCSVRTSIDSSRSSLPPTYDSK